MAATSRRKKAKSQNQNRWVAGVTTESTFPPKDLFKRARSIARAMAAPRVSPKGIGSGCGGNDASGESAHPAVGRDALRLEAASSTDDRKATFRSVNRPRSGDPF